MTRHERRVPTLATAFDPRGNSLNALRLAFAALVMIYHGIAAGGYGHFRLGHYDAGEFAVDGFFVISGFLIVRSRLESPSTGRYLWHRFLRIFPAFWVCLIVTANLFGTLGWIHERGSLSGYASAPHGPVQYMVENSALVMRFYDIGGTPSDVPFSPSHGGLAVSWNASLWTLSWEFLCYLGIAVLAIRGILARRRVLVLGLAAFLWLVTLAHALAPAATTRLDGSTASAALRFSLLFLCGALLYLYREKVPISGALAASAAALVAVALFQRIPYPLMDLPLAYLCLWLGIRLPLRRVGARNDLSYGLYIYAFPVQQLAAVYGLYRHGPWAYLPVTTAGAFAFAAASWFAVERPALARKNRPVRRPATAPAAYRPSAVSSRVGAEQADRAPVAADDR